MLSLYIFLCPNCHLELDHKEEIEVKTIEDKIKEMDLDGTAPSSDAYEASASL